jgi:hypothetical protein
MAVQQQMAGSLVRDLMVELAEEDAHRRAVNGVLYARSATYQRTLDDLLGALGSFVLQTDNRQYRVQTRPA